MKRAALWLLAPLSLYMLVFYGVPLVMVCLQSLTGPSGPTLDNYARVLQWDVFGVFVRSIGYATLATLVCLLLGYPMAYCIALYGGRYKTSLLILIMLPFWTSYLIRTYAWIVILRSHGFINETLMGLGVLSEPLQMLNTPFSVVLGLVYGFLPFMTLPLYVALEKLDPRLLEASADLGARPLDTFLKVTFPLSLPGVFAGTILTFIPAVGDFVTPELLGGPGTEMIGKFIMMQFFVADNWPLGSAVSFLLMVLMMVGLLIYRRKAGGAEL